LPFPGDAGIRLRLNNRKKGLRGYTTPFISLAPNQDRIRVTRIYAPFSPNKSPSAGLFFPFTTRRIISTFRFQSRNLNIYISQNTSALARKSYIVRKKQTLFIFVSAIKLIPAEPFAPLPNPPASSPCRNSPAKASVSGALCCYGKSRPGISLTVCPFVSCVQQTPFLTTAFPGDGNFFNAKHKTIANCHVEPYD
jgi:hypothetical protein